MISLSLLLLGIACYSIKELALHGKLRWSGKHTSFWGNNSWMRKYNYKGDMYRDLPPDNWYYRTFSIDYKERFPLSATALVFLTDGMHLAQFFFLLFLSLSVSIPLELGWNEFLEWALVWSLSHLVHFFTYWILQKK
jgi:hypothetical protein